MALDNLVKDVEAKIKENPDSEVVSVRDNSDLFYEHSREADFAYDYSITHRRGIYDCKEISEFMDSFIPKGTRPKKRNPSSCFGKNIGIYELGEMLFPPISPEQKKIGKEIFLRIRFLPNSSSSIYTDGEWRDGYHASEKGININRNKFERIIAHRVNREKYTARTKEEIMRAIALSGAGCENEVSEEDVNLLVGEGFVFRPSRRRIDYEIERRERCESIPIRFCLPNNRKKFETFVSKVKEGYLAEFYKLKLLTDCGEVSKGIYSKMKHDYAHGVPVWTDQNTVENRAALSSPPIGIQNAIALAKEVN